jgi:hypothetical protein
MITGETTGKVEGPSDRRYTKERSDIGRAERA